MLKSIQFVLVGVLTVVLLVGALPEAPTASAQSAELTPDALANATYLSEYAVDGEISLVDGQAEEEIAPGSASELSVTLIEPTAYGDLDGDGVDDAAVLLTSSSGGSGLFTDLHAVLNEDGEPVDAASIFLGDRVQVNSLVIEGGQIIVELVTQGPNDPMCCPTERQMLNYQLVDGELVATSNISLSLEALGNLSYQLDAAPGGEVELVDGLYKQDSAAGSAAKLIIERTGYGAFGDINGDGVEDAAIVLLVQPGGSGTFYELAAVVDQDGDYVNMATAPLGDRIVVNDVSIEDGVIFVDMVTQGPDDPMCCPTQHVLRSYVLEDDALTLVEEVELPALTSAGGVFQPEADPLAATLTLGGTENNWLNPTLISIFGGVAAGTPVEANTLGVTCAGNISERPDVVLEWAQDDAVETLRIFMLSLGDPTLVVVTPSGDILCNDDYTPLVADPYLRIDAPEAGRYAIYAGSFEGSAVVPGFLVVTSHDLNPAVMDLAQMFPRQANPDAVRNPQPAEAMQVDGEAQIVAETTISPELTPFTQTLTAGGSLGAFDVELGNQACTGFVTPAPTFTFDWEGKAEKLVIFFEADADTTLIVRDLNGIYQCNDDLDGAKNLNPYLDLTPIPGSHQVWVGSYAPDVAVDGVLTITGDTTVRPRILIPGMIDQ